MATVEGGPQGPSYTKASSSDLSTGHFKIPPFEPLSKLRNILWEEGSQKDKVMEIDLGPDHAKETLI